MNSQVVFYGSIQRAQTVLGAIQASITGANEVLSRKGARADLCRLIESHIYELEAIEADLVATINVYTDGLGGSSQNSGVLGDPGRDVHGE